VQQKVAAVAILSAISALTVAVLYVPATVPSPAPTPSALTIPGSEVPRLGRSAPRRGGPGSRVPGSRVPGSEVPGTPPRALRAAAGQAGFPGSEVQEARERLDVRPPLESRAVTGSVTSDLASSRTGDLAIVTDLIPATAPAKDGAMTTAGKSVGRAFGTAGRSVAAAFRKAF